MVPLTAMLVSPDPEHFRSAAAAIAALANPQNRAFQVQLNDPQAVLIHATCSRPLHLQRSGLCFQLASTRRVLCTSD